MTSKLSPLEFACLMNRFQNKIGVHLESDLVAAIYTEYIRTFYHKYTLFQLITMLDEMNVYVAHDLNKKALCEIIQKRQLILPDKERYSLPEKTEWHIYNLRYIDHLYTHSVHVSQNLIIITNANARAEITQNDVYKFDGKEYVINKIGNESVTLVSKDLDNNIESEMPLTMFIQKLDQDDCEVVLNNFRERKCNHWYMDRKIKTGS